jgi:hypothetical protein
MAQATRLVLIQGGAEEVLQPDLFSPPVRVSVYEGYEQIAAFEAEPGLDHGAIEWIRRNNWKKESR